MSAFVHRAGHERSFFVCPRTRAALFINGMMLESGDCERTYFLCGDLPIFLNSPAAESPSVRRRLQELNRRACEDGWRTALEAMYADDPAFIRYVTDPGRDLYMHLLPIEQREVLEIGCGLGQSTVSLARKARFVHALEVVEEQARFALERCRQSGADNVAIAVGGDDCRLPYPDHAFDVVVLNLVFEWCASRCLDEAPEDVQRRLLSEVARVLRPGGCLYLATKNRFALRYVLGKADEHCHRLPFGHALPRWLLGAVLRLLRRERPAGLLHSHNALKRMVASEFDVTCSYWALPEMRFPTHFVPTDAASVRAARRSAPLPQGESSLTRLLMPLIPARLVKHFTPGLVFVARKRG